MDTNVLLSKTYASEAVEDYLEIVNNVNEIISRTGYNGRFIAEKLDISESSFYVKKRNKSFSVNEIKRIIELMDEDDDDIDDEFFLKMYEERKNDRIIHDIFNVAKEETK
jgi:hypothetical protein